MSYKIDVDPSTQKDVLVRAKESFVGLLEELSADGFPMERIDWADWTELAEQFYTNGFINGALEVLHDDEFKETISLLKDEIDYQRKNNK